MKKIYGKIFAFLSAIFLYSGMSYSQSVGIGSASFIPGAANMVVQKMRGTP